MIHRRVLKCSVCGCEQELPNDRSIRQTSMMPMPLHRVDRQNIRDFKPVETKKDPQCCPGSELLAFVELRGEPQFKKGDSVIIASIHPSDGITTRAIIGHTGHIEEVEPLCNGDFNYDMKCVTCKGTHYMHEVELKLLDH